MTLNNCDHEWQEADHIYPLKADKEELYEWIEKEICDHCGTIRTTRFRNTDDIDELEIISEDFKPATKADIDEMFSYTNDVKDFLESKLRGDR